MGLVFCTAEPTRLPCHLMKSLPSIILKGLEQTLQHTAAQTTPSRGGTKQEVMRPAQGDETIHNVLTYIFLCYTIGCARSSRPATGRLIPPLATVHMPTSNKRCYSEPSTRTHIHRYHRYTYDFMHARAWRVYRERSIKAHAKSRSEPPPDTVLQWRAAKRYFFGQYWWSQQWFGG